MGLSDGHWVRFAFSFMNAIVFTFVVRSFIGLRGCVEDALVRHPRLQTSILRLLGDISDEGFAQGSQYGIRNAPFLGKAALYEATNADPAILGPGVASPLEILDALEMPSLTTVDGAGLAQPAAVSKCDTF
jgi:hypothetical protein